MSDEKPPQTFGSPPDYGLTSKTDDSLVAKPIEVGKEGPFTALDSFIGEDGFNFKDVALENTEKEYGVARSTDGRGHEALLFDGEIVAEHEKEVISKFLSIVDEKGIEGLKGTYFEWFFGNMSDEFIKDLAGKLRERLANIDKGQSTPPTLASQSLKEDSFMQTAESFRDMARRRQVREALDKQFDKLPIKGFIGIMAGGQEEEIDPKNIDYIFANNAKGDAELIITCTNTDRYTEVIPIYYPAEEEIQDKTFRRTPGTGEIRTVTTDKKSGRDLTHYEFLVTGGAAGIDPLFTRVRVLTAPVNLDEEIKQYEDAKEQRRKQQQAKKAATQPSTYTSPAPSYPSQPSRSYENYPTTYVSSSRRSG